MTRLIFLLGVLLLVADVAAQSPPPAETFEAADVRAAAPNPLGSGPRGGLLRGNRYEIRNATMLGLISSAYGMEAEKVMGGPPWLELHRFDLAALASPGTKPETLRAMLRMLLADRFKLVVHEDKQQVDGLILSAGARTRLRTSAGGQANCQLNPQTPPGRTVLRRLVCTNMNMPGFASRLPLFATDYISESLENLIDDQTRLAGAWDFELEWTPRDQLLQAGADSVTLQQALESIGLRLAEGKVAVTVLVVDSVNAAPTPNAADAAAKLPPLPPPQFEVASIRPSPPGVATSRSRLLPTGQVEFSATPLRQMMNFAWQVPGNDYLVAPDWVDTKRFDVVGRGWATPITDAWRENDRLLLMLRQLLVDRFKMKYHMENRPVDAFVLTAGTRKMTQANPLTRTRCGGSATTTRNPAVTRVITCQNVTMAQFVEELPEMASDYVRGPVADMTALEGTWDFTVTYSPQSVYNQSGVGGDAGGASTPTGAVSIFEALDRQLGLRLGSEKRPVPVMVIDSISEEVD